MKNKIITILIVSTICLIGISAISAHGVDITTDTMIIANEDNGVLAKKIADDNGINISVYKFTSEDEVEHQLEHMLTNENKKILVLAYQDVATSFLDKHPEVSDRLIVEKSVNNNTIKEDIMKITNTKTQSEDVSSSNGFIVPLVSGLVVGFIIGLSCGIVLMKKKN